MKKYIIILGLVAGLTACNNNGDGNENLEDSILENVDSAADARVDSIKEAADSLEGTIKESFDKTDSANAANADSMGKNQ